MLIMTMWHIWTNISFVDMQSSTPRADEQASSCMHGMVCAFLHKHYVYVKLALAEHDTGSKSPKGSLPETDGVDGRVVL